MKLLRALGFGSAGYDVAGKVALVTGAGQGIGLELVRILHARGAIVVVVDIDAEAALRVARELRTRALSIGADVADRGQMADAVAQVIEQYGRLDVVVANAGVTPMPSTVRAMDPADFDRVMSINLTGAFNTVHPALEHIVRSHGHVVVVSSCAAFAPGMGGSPYMISKAAVEQMGRALRVELSASGASAGVAYFGIVETAMTHDMLDADDLGRRIDALLPWPLNIRITATQAARTVADSIGRRAPRTVAPASWEPYALFRGAINVVLDAKLSADSTVHQLIHDVEAQRKAQSVSE
ncbi:short-chain dehydrogenase/reductase [Nocardia macrotermitis]|uniref:3-phenylpropionate-dihydrodiol/cinnamic acid-dihydrodiol dehydrogenase n=1 Tax=Nocardia macrotermitis TaxID=2585198 RepID=A0A7K0CZI2_9NOCA|nr:short-chain dehydrogenase/reductase [Nocardia macrotermitis]MQY18362.1 3-phenylpropionate-dihydrodiol/cinnamic acid-dihydrodiol dehydrogenase [Nocardia macrotermitis]